MIFGVSTVGSWSISGSHPYKGKIKPHTNVTVNCVNIFQAKLKLLVSPTLLQWYSEIPMATPKPPYIKGSVMEEKTEWDVRAIWLRHLSPHWSPGLIRLIWLARRVSPSSLTAPCASLPNLRARSKRTTIPARGGPVFGQGYTSSCAPLLEPPNKLSRSICRRT